MVAVLAMQCSPKTTKSAMEDKAKTEMATKNDFRKAPPAAGPAPKINIGESNSFKLDNGLQVIVVENHKLPRVSFQISLKNEPIKEYDKVGYVSMAGQLMGRGTETRSKAELDEAIDFMGASLNTFSTGMFASSLSKHTPKLLDLMTEVLYQPAFKQEELDKIKKQTLSGLQAAKTDPGSMMSNMRAKLLYGDDHPYGEIQTEEHVGNIDLASIKEYYNKFFIPNNAFLIIVGDITPDAAKDLANKHFGSWEKRSFKPVKHKSVAMPDKRKVAFAHKDGAVQSIINVTYPVELKPGAPDVVKARVMNTILGGGFNGRLNLNLREDKAYTYGAGSSISSDALVGNFNASTSVRNEVTDSSVTQILHELNVIRDTPVDPVDLQNVKNYMTKSFTRSLESPQTIARFALNIFKYNLPADYFETYLERLNAVTVEDVQMMAQKYIQPDKAYVMIVGNKDEVSEPLKQFDVDEEVTFYNPFGVEIDYDAVAVPDGITAAQVIDDYLTAIGGKETISAIKSAQMKMSSEVMGQQMEMNSYYDDGKFAMTIGTGGMTVQDQRYDGTKAMVSAMGQKQVITEGPQLDAMKKQATLFSQTQYGTDAYTLELMGIEEVEGQNAYKVKVTDAAGTAVTEFYSMDSGLLLRNTTTQGEATITTDFMDYKKFGNVLYPQITKISGMMPVPVEMKVSDVTFGGAVDAAVFSIEE